LANLGLALVSTALVLGLAEAVLRFVDNTNLTEGTWAAEIDIPQDSLANAVTDEEERAFRWDGKGDGLLHVRSANPRMVFEMRPNVHLNEFVSTNSDGFRDREFSREKAKNTFRIAAVGDSITFGWFQRVEQTYTKVLESLLNAQAAPDMTFEVYNFGIGCYNVEQEVALIKDRVFRHQPDLLLVQYCSNDGQIGVDSGLYGHFIRGKSRVCDLFYRVWLRWRERDQGRFLLEGSYRELLAWVKERHIPTLVMVMPTNCDVNDQVARDTAMIRRLGFNTLSISDAYRTFPGEQLFADHCLHPNSLGSRIAAEELLKRLCSDASLGAADRLKHPPPDYAQARLDLRAGLDDLQAKRLDAAAEMYGRAVSAVPEYGPYAAWSLAGKAADPSMKATPAEALHLMQLAVSWDPNRPQGYLEMARLLAASGQQQEALRTYRRCISLWQKQPDNVAPGAGLAHAYAEMVCALVDADELDEANRMMAEALAQYPQNPHVLIAKAALGIKLGECDKAGNTLFAVIQQDPDDCRPYELLLSESPCVASDGFAGIWTSISQRFTDQFHPQYFSGRFFARRHQWPEAHRALERALALRPGAPNALAAEIGAWMDEARDLEKDGNLEQALALAQKAEHADANALGARSMIARLRGKLGNLDEAKRICLEDIEARPKDEYAYAELYDLYATAGDWPGLRREWETLATRMPGISLPWTRLAETCAWMKDFAGARLAAERALAVSPQDAAARDLLLRTCAQQARALLDAGQGGRCATVTDWAVARDAAERAVALAPEDPGICELLANIYVQQASPLLETGQEAACAALLDKALRLHGRHQEALYLSACFAEARGDLHLAREIYRDIIMAAYSEDFRPYMLLSQTYDETADKEAIVAEWQFMVCACPADYLVHYNLGLALDRTGDSAAAREAYRTVLALRPDAPDSLVLPDRIRKN
jgi:tetratricopeptide (TPR) repeat protein